MKKSAKFLKYQRNQVDSEIFTKNNQLTLENLRNQISWYNISKNNYFAVD